MKAYNSIIGKYLMLFTTMLFAPFAVSRAAPYEALKGLEGVEMVFDIQIKNPQKAALFLKLIHEAYHDKDLHNMAKSPKFVVIFNAESVTLITKEQSGFPEKDQPFLQEIENRIQQMAEDGIRIEGCLIAAEIFKLDPDLFYDKIHMVNNGWISLAGYQAKRFSMLPVY